MASVFEKKSTHYYIDNHFFFFFFESVMLSTQEHILKSTYILQSSHHEPFKWTLFKGDGGARMYIKSIIKL